MNLVRCEKGHFYDKDKNGDHCPYCAQMASAASSAPSPAPAAPAPGASAPAQTSSAQSSSARPAPAQSNPAPAPAAPTQNAAAGPAVSPAASPAQPIQPQPAPVPAAPFPSSAAAPVQTAAPQTGQTAAADSMMDTEDNCTIGYYSRVIGVEPVVGWLVCTEGEYKGESFKLKSGRNFIGRAANMDVVLSADHSISRFKHAAVIYEPRSRQFIVTAGESRELCYLNGDVVLSNMKMEAYDVLNLGNTSLMLVPCCGKRFSWENGLEKEPEDNE